MSNYTRNRGVVMCIVAVIVAGAIAVGLLTYYGTSYFNWTTNHDWNNTIEYNFERSEETMPDVVLLDIDIGAGAVSISFQNDSSLLYRIVAQAPNHTVQQHGAPVVSYGPTTITLNYHAAGVNITLGTGCAYRIDVDTGTSAINVNLNETASVGDVSLKTGTGAISLCMDSTTNLYESPSFSLETGVGAISIVLVLPGGIGGQFSASATFGTVEVVPTGWDVVEGNTYATPNYDTALQTLTISVTTVTGAVDAVLNVS